VVHSFNRARKHSSSGLAIIRHAHGQGRLARQASGGAAESFRINVLALS